MLPTHPGSTGHANPGVLPDAQLSIAALYRQLWRFAAGDRIRYIFALVLLGSSQLLKLGIPWLAARAIDTVQSSGPAGFAAAARDVGLVLIVSSLAWAMHGPGRILERNVALGIRKRMADDLYARLVSLPYAWHEKQHAGSLQHRVQQSTQSLFDFAQGQFVYLQNAINIAGPLAALTLISLSTGMLALLGFTGIAIVIVGFDRRLMVLAATENAAERQYVTTLVDFLSNVATVLTLNARAPARRLLGERLKASFAPLREAIRMNEAKWCAVDLMTIALCWGLVAWRAAVLIRMTPAATAPLFGSIFMVYQYANQAAGVIVTLAANFQNFANVRTQVASANPIWNAVPANGPGTAVDAHWRRIDCMGLSYRHGRDDGRACGLIEASLSIRRGARIALVGPSGSGKSTFMRVLAGLYPIQAGRFSIEGILLSDSPDLSSLCRLVIQEAQMFEGSIRENLTLGADMEDAKIRSTIRVCQLESVIKGLPGELDAHVAAAGANLSGGQRQRIALARALLAQGSQSIILLDEPTSALDPLTETRVLEGLFGLDSDLTWLVSVHRLTTLDHFTEIALFDEGRLIDLGPVDEVEARQPLLQRLRGGFETR